MIRKYAVLNQTTGIQEESDSFEEIKAIRKKLIEDYVKSIESVFSISVLVKNSDDTWTQSVADENGNPIVFTKVRDE